MKQRTERNTLIQRNVKQNQRKMSQEKLKILIKIIESQQKQLDNGQAQIAMLTKELVKLSEQVEKLVIKK